MMAQIKSRPKAAFYPSSERADVRGRGPFKMLLDDYNALAIGHTGCAFIHEKSTIRKFFAFSRTKSVCEIIAPLNFKNIL